MKIDKVAFTVGMATLVLSTVLLTMVTFFPSSTLPPEAWARQPHLKGSLNFLAVLGLLMGGLLAYLSITAPTPTSLNSQTANDN